MGYKKPMFASSGYLGKMQKRAEINRTVHDVMNSQAYKQAMKEQQEQAALRGYCNFCLMACDYLQLKHNYGHKGFNHFLAFAAKRLNYATEDNERYFQEMNQYFVDELKTDVLGILGLKVEQDEADRTCTCGKIIHVSAYKFCPHCGSELKGGAA